MPFRCGVRRWLIHVLVLSIAFSALLLLPVHYSHTVGPYLAADYDYRVASVDSKEREAILSQPFVQQQCTLYPTNASNLYYRGKCAEAEIVLCGRECNLDLSWYSSKRFISSLPFSDMDNMESYVILDYRLARCLSIRAGDELEIDGFSTPLKVAAVDSMNVNAVRPSVVIVSENKPVALVPRGTSATMMFVSVSDFTQADYFFSEVYPWISDEVDDEDRFKIARQTFSTRSEDIDNANEGILKLGLIVVLYVLGCIFIGVYTGRFVSQLASLHKMDYATLYVLGMGRMRLCALTVALSIVQLLTAGTVSCFLSKIAIERITALAYSPVEHATFVAPYMALLVLVTVVSAVTLCICPLSSSRR